MRAQSTADKSAANKNDNAPFTAYIVRERRLERGKVRRVVGRRGLVAKAGSSKRESEGLCF